MRWVAALVLVLALVAAGCGGGDDESAAVDETTTTVEETTTDEATTDETTTGETDLSGLLADEDCQALVAAAASFAQAFAGASGTADEANAFEELADKVPAEIQADVRVLAEAYAKYAAELQDVGIESGQTPTLEQIQQLQAALASLDQQRVAEASERLSAWAQENCPSG